METSRFGDDPQAVLTGLLSSRRNRLRDWLDAGLLKYWAERYVGKNGSPHSGAVSPGLESPSKLGNLPLYVTGGGDELLADDFHSFGRRCREERAAGCTILDVREHQVHDHSIMFHAMGLASACDALDRLACLGEDGGQSSGHWARRPCHRGTGAHRVAQARVARERGARTKASEPVKVDVRRAPSSFGRWMAREGAHAGRHEPSRRVYTTAPKRERERARERRRNVAVLRALAFWAVGRRFCLRIYLPLSERLIFARWRCTSERMMDPAIAAFNESADATIGTCDEGAQHVRREQRIHRAKLDRNAPVLAGSRVRAGFGPL
eukprot:scaffold1090_cov265-Pinguiococcus_pyrenoidosus.AAC.4